MYRQRSWHAKSPNFSYIQAVADKTSHLYIHVYFYNGILLPKSSQSQIPNLCRGSDRLLLPLILETPCACRKAENKNTDH